MAHHLKDEDSKQTAPENYSHTLAGVLNASCGLCWTAAYVLYVQQAHRDHSYGMPLGALVLNLSWEFVYTFLWPVHGIGRIFHFPWVFVDAWVFFYNNLQPPTDHDCLLNKNKNISLLLAQTVKHGPLMWKETSPIVAQNFTLIVCICAFLALTAQWCFAHQFSKNNSCFWSAYICQNVSFVEFFRREFFFDTVYLFIWLWWNIQFFFKTKKDFVLGITVDVVN